MSPEQHRGERADARSDQFSFCVALYRALYGEPPFAATTVAGLAEEIAQGRVRDAPRESRVPPWVRRVVVRGLSAAPEARYPSMEALLADLGRDPAAKRWRVHLGAAVALLVGGAAATGWAMGAFRDPSLTDTLLGLGELRLARGEASRSVSMLERALTLADPELKNDVRLTLAEALYRLGQDRPRSRTLAGEALADYQRIGHKPGIERATRWLADHPDGT
jgi:hypothetical protein